MIRVLQLLTGTAPGGGPRQVFDLVRHLPANEFSVSVAGPRDQRFAADLRALGIELVEVAVDGVRAFPMTLRAVERIVRDTRADLVHTHGKGAGLYGRLAAWLVGVPAVHTFHGIHYESYSRASQTLYLALERWLAGLTHTVINVSETQQEEALALRVARPGRCVVVVNGIDIDELAARPASGKAALGLNADDHVLGCVARFDPIKRHEVLLEALGRVVKRRPNVVLLLAGEGPEKARIDQHADRLKVRVVNPGAIAWQTNPYSSCDLYVTASSKEGLPLAPLEASSSTERLGCSCLQGMTRRCRSPSSRSWAIPGGAGGWDRRDGSACGKSSRCNRWSRRRRRCIERRQLPEGLVVDREAGRRNRAKAPETIEQIPQAAGAKLSGSFLFLQRPLPGEACFAQLTDGQVRAVAEQHRIDGLGERSAASRRCYNH